MEKEKGRYSQRGLELYGNGRMEKLAHGLGWFSIGLGLAEVVVPRTLAGLIGIRDRAGTRALLRFYGLREIAAGVGLLTQRRPAGWLWSRVGGDVVDLASLGWALASEESNRTRVALATAAVAGVTALDVYCGREMKNAPLRASHSIIINRPAEEVYRFWQNFEELPRVMPHLESVERAGEKRLRWKTVPAAGRAVEWESEIREDVPNSFISWRSLPGSDMDSSGSVRFERATGGRGTLVRLTFEYVPPGGPVGATIAKLLGLEPGQEVERGLRRLKQILETGDIVRSDASIHHGMHAARPPKEAPSLPRRSAVSPAVPV